MVYLLILIPISFSGLGVREGAMLLLLIPYGVDAESTVAFSMLSFLAILIMGFWGGGYELYACSNTVIGEGFWKRGMSPPGAKIESFLCLLRTGSLCCSKSRANATFDSHDTRSWGVSVRNASQAGIGTESKHLVPRRGGLRFLDCARCAALVSLYRASEFLS